MNRRVWQRGLILAGKIGLAGGLLAWLVLSGRLTLTGWPPSRWIGGLQFCWRWLPGP